MSGGLFDLIDDLKVNELQALLTHLWVRRVKVSRAEIKAWRRSVGLALIESDVEVADNT